MSRKRKLEEDNETGYEPLPGAAEDSEHVRFKIKRTKLADPEEECGTKELPLTAPSSEEVQQSTSEDIPQSASEDVQQSAPEEEPQPMAEKEPQPVPEKEQQSAPDEAPQAEADQVQMGASSVEPSQPSTKLPPTIASPSGTPLFNVESLGSQAHIVKTPFSSRKSDQHEDKEGKEKKDATGSLVEPPVEKLEPAFPHFNGTPECAVEKASTPPSSRPQHFPGEEDEEAVLSDFNTVLLKCVNTATEGERPLFKYRQTGTGVVRVLEESSSKRKRIVFRQTGTWQVYLNSPLELVGCVEIVDQSTSFAVKFTALDAMTSTSDQPKLAPFCIKFPDASSRNGLVKVLSPSD